MSYSTETHLEKASAFVFSTTTLLIFVNNLASTRFWFGCEQRLSICHRFNKYTRGQSHSVVGQSS